MRFDISQSVYPDGKIRYIARDRDGIVRLRANSEGELQDAIKKFNEDLAEQLAKKVAAKAKPKKDEHNQAGVTQTDREPSTTGQIVTSDTVEPESNANETETTPATSVPAQSEEKKEFLGSDVKKQAEERRRGSSSKSFWDKLK